LWIRNHKPKKSNNQRKKAFKGGITLKCGLNKGLGPNCVGLGGFLHQKKKKPRGRKRGFESKKRVGKTTEVTKSSS